MIFDMDGVIIDSHPAHREAWRMFLRTLGKSVSDADLDFVLDGRKRGEILSYFLGKLSEVEMREYGERKDEYFREASLQVKPVPGVVKFIRTLENAGIATAVATSASESRTRHTLEHLRLIRHVRVIVTGDDVALGKPDPSIYVLACARLNVNPGHAVAIEDAVSGIKSARGSWHQLHRSGQSSVSGQAKGGRSCLRCQGLLEPFSVSTRTQPRISRCHSITP